MKRSGLIIALLCCLSQVAMAGIVSPDMAARCAGQLLGSDQLQLSDAIPSSRSNVRGNESSAPDYYIFNNPQGGWAIIAADDRVRPVLGYSESGSFSATDVPGNVEVWMEDVHEVMERVRKSTAQAPESVREAWNALTTGTARGQSQRVELETPLWSQDSPYNDLCPIVTAENKRAYAGCLATAMAIVARFNCWPERGKGVIGGYTTQTHQTYIPAYSIEDHVYDWNQMPLTEGHLASSRWTTTQKEQVAQLIHDCGVMIEMDYSYSLGSSAYADYVPRELQEHFSYSASSVCVYRSAYSEDDWYSMICNEIDNNRVVIYCGANEYEGHAFVCDGYDSNERMLRINWGWGGAYNGFFSLEMVVDSIAQPDVAFGSYQTAVIGLAPNTNDVDIPEQPRLLHDVGEGLFGLSPVLPADMKEGQAVSFNAGWFHNTWNMELSQDFMVRLMDSNGNVRQEGWKFNISFPSSGLEYYSATSSATVLEVTPNLTDYFMLFVKDGNGEWVPACVNRDVFPEAEGICCGVTRDPVVVLSDSPSALQEVRLSLTLGFIPVSSVKWYVNGAELRGDKFVIQPGKTEIMAKINYMDGSDGTIFKTITAE